MRARSSVLVAGSVSIFALVAGLCLVPREEGPDRLSVAELSQLLQRPVNRAGQQQGDAPLLWLELLERFAEHTPDGLRLRLGRVLSDPTTARSSAESAGELLALEAAGPAGELGTPLWRAILAGPALERGEGRSLKLYGCRHSALPSDGPVLEDSYYARLSLARALRTHAAGQGEPLTLLGEETPRKGGVNFEVQLVGGVQSVTVTFDGHDAPPLRASRPFSFAAPNDGRARAGLVAALRELASSAGLGALSIEGAEAPFEGGVDVRIEEVGTRQTLVATRGRMRLSAHRELVDSQSEERSGGARSAPLSRSPAPEQ